MHLKFIKILGIGWSAAAVKIGFLVGLSMTPFQLELPFFDSLPRDQSKLIPFDDG